MAHGIGRTKGGRNTKLHAVCDTKGRPQVLLLTPGNVHDCKVAKTCIEALPPSAELVADKGYDSQELREWLDGRGTQPVIPPRRNRKIQYDYDRAIYKQRNIIERMFCRLKDWRRLATRFDRNVKNFMSAIALAAAVIWWLYVRNLDRAVAGVSQRMLAKQLRDLERAGLISRTVYAEVPPRVEYQMTSAGEELRPVLQSVREWYARNRDGQGAASRK